MLLLICKITKNFEYIGAFPLKKDISLCPQREMRMQRSLWGIWVLSLLLPCVGGAAENRRVYKVDTLAMNSIVQKYSAALAALSHDTTAFPLDTGMRYAPPFFRLLTPGTLYDAPMRQAFSVSWTPALPAKADPSLI